MAWCVTTSLLEFYSHHPNQSTTFNSPMVLEPNHWSGIQTRFLNVTRRMNNHSLPLNLVIIAKTQVFPSDFIKAFLFTYLFNDIRDYFIDTFKTPKPLFQKYFLCEFRNVSCFAKLNPLITILRVWLLSPLAIPCTFENVLA